MSEPNVKLPLQNSSQISEKKSEENPTLPSYHDEVKPHGKTHVPPKPSQNFNYYIAKFFLENSRLAILSFVLLLILGVGSVLLLKTTGFPNPEIKIALVQTVYPGASSETVLDQVTQPIENSIKDITGVESYTSSSTDSFSNVTVSIKADANSDSVRSKIDSAVKGVTLPSAAQTPKVVAPQVSGANLIISIADNDLGKVYSTYTELSKQLNELPETSGVTQQVELKQQVVLTLNDAKLKESGITVTDIQNQLASVGESLPVVSNVSLDGQNQSILTSVSNKTIDELKNIEFRPSATISGSAPTASAPAGNPAATTQPTVSAPVRVYKLSDLAKVDVKYSFADNQNPKISFPVDGKGQSLTALTIEVRTAEGTDLGKYTNTVEDKLKSLPNSKFFEEKEIKPENGKTSVIVNFTTDKSNREQVGEVVEGLIGGKLDVDNQVLAQSGWLLGGIQLVFLVMLAFVSWRAALVAASAIPLSLIFSTIYLYATGQSLNTLVLFSLVLVIGLVVDPALVVLEAIQRKVDTGITGKEAALAAIKDVGMGVFLAALNNTIVFAPFGVISGVLGQIFSYIPLTVIPAIIGSYIVPLIFLSYLGANFLKPSKNASEDEEKNLWGVARGLIRLNQNILDGSRVVRLIIVAVALSLSLGVAGYYFGSGQVKQVSFSSSRNGEYLGLDASFLPDQTIAQKQDVTKQVLESLAGYSDVVQVFPTVGSSNGLSYYIQLKPAKERSKITADLAKDVGQDLQDKFKSKFFDIGVSSISNGPPASSYQVSLAIKTDDLAKLKTASVEVGRVFQLACFKDQKVTISDSCDGDRIVKKIDDGYTNKESKSVVVELDRNKLNQYKLTVPNAPASILVNQNLQSLFELNGGKSVGKVLVGDSETEIILQKDAAEPTTLNEISNYVIDTPTGQTVKLRDIAMISETTPKSSIQRVKGQTVGDVQAGLIDGKTDQGSAALVSSAVLKYFQDNDGQKMKDLGLNKDQIETYSEGGEADFIKSFAELGTALLLAIIFIYFILALFFNSFTQPIVILFTVPLTFLGIFPALASLGGGEFGFLEIIGLLILIGIVDNVAIFLIDAAKQKIEEDNWNDKRAISYASGVRLRPVLLTKFVAVASLAPLAVLSEQYRSLSIVIIFGLLTSGFTSLITTPILFIFFRWLSHRFRAAKIYNQILFFPFFPIYMTVWAIQDWLAERKAKKNVKDVKIEV